MQKSTLFIFALILLTGCKTQNTKLILETDMGNDIEDALAEQMSLRYIDTKKADLLAICVNKEGLAPLQYVDAMSTWYGHPGVPIGKITNGAKCKGGFAEGTMAQKDENGEPKYKGSVKDYDALPEAVDLYRELLSSQRDHSVVIASVGFSTNLLRLMKSGPDKYSKLTGEELVKKKVKKLAIMAGCFEKPNFVEYNIKFDIPSAKFIFEKWPTPIDVIPHTIGRQVHFPLSSVYNDFPWDPDNILAEGFTQYKRHRNRDTPMWDTPTVVLAVEGDERFNMTPKGRVIVDDKGYTTFVEDENGMHRVALLTDEKAKVLQEYIIREITTQPVNWKPQK